MCVMSIRRAGHGVVVLRDLGADVRSTCGDAAAVLLRGEFDFGCGEILRDAFARVTTSGTERIVVDVSGVTFLDCGGLRLLERTAAACDREVWLRAPSRPVRRIAELTGGIGPTGWTGSTPADDVRLS